MSIDMRTWVNKMSGNEWRRKKKETWKEPCEKRIIGERNVGLHAVPRELHGRGTTESILFITRSSYDDGALTYVAPGRL